MTITKDCVALKGSGRPLDNLVGKVLQYVLVLVAPSVYLTCVKKGSGDMPLTA